jgi:hypothetical protein
MKLRTSFIILLSIALSLPALAAPRDNAETPLTRQLLDLEKSFADAQQRHDRDSVNNALAHDFVSINNNGEAQTKADILSDVPSDNRQEYRIYNPQVVPVNDSAAVVTYDVIVRMVHYDEDTPRYQHVSSVWVKQGSDWKLKFRQATPTEMRH